VDDPSASDVHREIGRLVRDLQKVVVSDTLVAGLVDELHRRRSGCPGLRHAGVRFGLHPHAAVGGTVRRLTELGVWSTRTTCRTVVDFELALGACSTAAKAHWCHDTGPGPGRRSGSTMGESTGVVG